MFVAVECAFEVINVVADWRPVRYAVEVKVFRELELQTFAIVPAVDVIAELFQLLIRADCVGVIGCIETERADFCVALELQSCADCVDERAVGVFG